MTSKMLNGLYTSIQEIRDNNFEDSLKKCKEYCYQNGTVNRISRRHKIKRMDGEEAIDDGATSVTTKLKIIFTWQLTQSYLVKSGDLKE